MKGDGGMSILDLLFVVLWGLGAKADLLMPMVLMEITLVSAALSRPLFSVVKGLRPEVLTKCISIAKAISPPEWIVDLSEAKSRKLNNQALAGITIVDGNNAGTSPKDCNELYNTYLNQYTGALIGIGDKNPLENMYGYMSINFGIQTVNLKESVSILKSYNLWELNMLLQESLRRLKCYNIRVNEEYKKGFGFKNGGNLVEPPYDAPESIPLFRAFEILGILLSIQFDPSLNGLNVLRGFAQQGLLLSKSVCEYAAKCLSGHIRQSRSGAFDIPAKYVRLYNIIRHIHEIERKAVTVNLILERANGVRGLSRSNLFKQLGEMEKMQLIVKSKKHPIYWPFDESAAFEPYPEIGFKQALEEVSVEDKLAELSSVASPEPGDAGGNAVGEEKLNDESADGKPDARQAENEDQATEEPVSSGDSNVNEERKPDDVPEFDEEDEAFVPTKYLPGFNDDDEEDEDEDSDFDSDDTE